jgi:hypothetical protein
MRVQLLLLLVTGTALSACTPKKIPGTDIDDNEDTQAVLAVVRKYRAAVEARNAEGIFQLCDKSFSDDGGTAVPDDDLEYESLKASLNKRMEHVIDLKLDLTVRRIEFDTDDKFARVTYSYNVSFKMPGYSSRTQSENDIKQMMLKRIDGQEWKITSGI